jgi:hypothetical protein
VAQLWDSGDVGIVFNGAVVSELEIVGSTLVVRHDGTQLWTGTDTTLTTGQPGIFFWSSGTGCILDTFSADEVGVGAAVYTETIAEKVSAPGEVTDRANREYESPTGVATSVDVVADAMVGNLAFIGCSPVYSVTGNGTTWNLPAGTQPGDLILLLGKGTPWPSTGWSAFGSSSDDYWKIAGSETSVTVIASGQTYGVILTFRFTGPIPLIASDTAAGVANGVSPRTGSKILVVYKANGLANLPAPTLAAGAYTTLLGGGGTSTGSVYVFTGANTTVAGTTANQGVAVSPGAWGGFQIGIQPLPVTVEEGVQEGAQAKDTVADVFHDINIDETVSGVAQAKEAPPSDPERDHIPGPLWEDITDVATAKIAVIMGKPNTQIEVQFAAFGGSDAYSGLVKSRTPGSDGVISLDRDKYLGRRLQLGKADPAGTNPVGDRVILRAVNSAIPKGGNGQVGRATLILTPATVWTFDDSQAVAGPICKVHGSQLNPQSVSPATALAETLTGDYGTIAMQSAWAVNDPYITKVAPGQTTNVGPTWLMGGRGQQTHTKARPQNPWEIDVTSLVNARITAAQDTSICLDFSPSGRTDLKTVCEFYGSLYPELAPRLEIDPFGASNIDIVGIDSGTPRMTVTVPVGGTLASIEWGYDTTYSGGYVTGPSKVDVWPTDNPYDFSMLETSARVYVRVTLAYGEGDDRKVELLRQFATPKVFRPALTKLASYPAAMRPRAPITLQSSAAGESCFWVQDFSTTWIAFKGFTTAPICIDENAGTWSNAFDPEALATTATGPAGATISDVGAAYYDHTSGAYYLPIVTLRGGLFDVSYVLAPTHFSTSWNIWDMQFVRPDINGGGYVQSINGINSAGAINGNSLAMGRVEDWRTNGDHDYLYPLFLTLNVQGRLRVLSTMAYAAGGFSHYVVAPTGWTLEIGPVGSGARLEVDFDADAGVTLLNTLTRDRVPRLVVAARASSGNCFIATRTGDVITTPVNGSDHVRTPGTWTSRSVPNFQNAYVTNPMPALNGIVDVPDGESTNIVLLRSSAPTVEFLRADTLAACRADARVSQNSFTSHAGTAEMVSANPTPWGTYGGAANTLTGGLQWYDGRIVDDLPTAFSALMQHPHGGATGFRVSGGNLYAQRYYDRLRLSPETAAAVSSGSNILPCNKAWEGLPMAVLVGNDTTGYDIFTATSAMDISRLDAPTRDLAGRYTTGALEIGTNVVAQDDSGLRGLRKGHGYNTFYATWQWDEDSINGDHNGLMNHAGTGKLKILGGKGQTARIHILNTSLGGGAWINEEFYPYGYFPQGGYNGSPELIGGLEYPMIRVHVWFISQDGGFTFEPVLGTQWIPCGESFGGEVILNLPVLQSDNVWITHEIPNDLETWQLKVTEWRARSANSGDTAYGLVHNVASNGDLMYLGANSAKLSLTASDSELLPSNRPMRVWDPTEPGNLTGVGCDSWKGLLLEDTTTLEGRVSKCLIINYGDEDSSEQTAGRNMLHAIDFLLGGSARAKALLRKFSFLYIPVAAQAEVKYGRARYHWDATDNGDGTFQPAMPGSLTPNGTAKYPWGNWGKVFSRLLLALYDQWAEHYPATATLTKDQTNCVFSLCTYHCDTHNRYTPQPAPLVPPFVNLAFPGKTPQESLDLYKQRFLVTAWREHVANQEATGYVAPLQSGAASIPHGGTSFLYETFWNAPLAKVTVWPGDDIMQNFAKAHLDGISMAGAAFDVYDETMEDAGWGKDTVYDTRVQNAIAAEAVEAKGVVTDKVTGTEIPAERVIAPDASVTQMQAAEVAAQAAKAGDQALGGFLQSDVVTGAAKAGDVSDDHKAFTEAGTGGAQAGDTSTSGRVATEAQAGAAQAPGAVADGVVPGAGPTIITETVTGVAAAGETVQDSAPHTPQTIAEVVTGSGRAASEVEHILGGASFEGKPVWPISLQSPFAESEPSYAPVDNFISSTVDVGPPKQRRRFTGKIEIFTFSMILTKAQRNAFQAWYWGSPLIGGIAEITPFVWKDFRKYGTPAIYKFTKPYKESYVAGDSRTSSTSEAYWRIDIELEKLL